MTELCKRCGKNPRELHIILCVKCHNAWLKLEHVGDLKSLEIFMRNDKGKEVVSFD